MQSAKLLLSRAATSRLPVLACLLVALAISLTCSLHYLPMTMDDALIGYRYSERLLNGQGLTWNDGEFVEGYSNLLWILLIAAGGLVQPDLILVGWTLGLIANACALVALVWTFGRPPGGSLFSVLSGLLMLSLSGAFAFWGIAGLETALVGALLAWALATTQRMGTGTWSWARPSLLLGLLSVARPDGILFGVSIAIALILRDGLNRKTIQLSARLLTLPVAFFFAQIGFRFAYYGTLVPNTAYAKLAFTMERVLLGGLYLAKGALVNSAPLIVIGAIALLVCRLQQWRVLRQALLFLVPGVVWLTYIGIIGGDWFLFQRHWMPALVCFAFTLSSLVAGSFRTTPGRFAIIATVATAFHVVFQNTVDPWELQFGTRLRMSTVISNIKNGMTPNAGSDLERYVRDWYAECIASSQFLRAAFDTQQPLLAVYRAGCWPYMTQFPSLDMLGLTDSYIAHHRPASMGKGPIAHELGDGAYVLSRKPDLIEYFDCPSGNGLCRIQWELSGDPEFRQLYRLVFYRIVNEDIPIWTRVEDGPLGIVRGANTIYIPGFLLATTSGAHAVLDPGQMPVAKLDHGDAVIENVYLPAGTWEVSLMADALSDLRLATSPATDTVVLRPDALRLVSHGTFRSFRVSGQRGEIRAITARALD